MTAIYADANIELVTNADGLNEINLTYGSPPNVSGEGIQFKVSVRTRSPLKVDDLKNLTVDCLTEASKKLYTEVLVNFCKHVLSAEQYAEIERIMVEDPV